MISKRGIFMKVIALDLLMLCFSINVSIVGQMFNSIKTSYQLSYSQASLLLSVQSVGGLTLAIISILLIDMLNKSRFLTVCGLLISLLVGLVGTQPPFIILFMIFIGLGFAGGAINTLTNPVMVETVPKNSERYINFMHMIFSLGAVLTPLISQIIYADYGLPGVFFIFGGFASICAGYAYLVFYMKRQKNKVKKDRETKRRIREAFDTFRVQEIRYIFVIAILITSWQLSSIYYISSYFKELSNDGLKGALALSIFFLGMMVSRLVFSKFADRLEAKRVLAVSNFIGAVVWVMIFIVDGFMLKLVLVGISAACCANNFPIVFSKACHAVPEKMAAASGFVTLGYYVAIFVLIPLIGSLGDLVGMRWALPLIAIFLILVIPFANKLSLSNG
ncbi:MAG: MFS transporter [Eubacteriales bacterium]